MRGTGAPTMPSLPTMAIRAVCASDKLTTLKNAPLCGGKTREKIVTSNQIAHLHPLPTYRCECAILLPGALTKGSCVGSRRAHGSLAETLDAARQTAIAP